MLNTVLVGIIGVMLTVGVIFFIDWWFAGKERQLRDVEEITTHESHTPTASEQSGSTQREQQRLADTGV